MSRAIGRNAQEGRALKAQAKRRAAEKAIKQRKRLPGMEADPAHHKGRPAFSGKPEQVSQLPTFELGDVYTGLLGSNPRKRLLAEITCGTVRGRCGKTFVIAVKDYWAEDAHKAGSCPNCFKASWRPAKPTGRTA